MSDDERRPSVEDYLRGRRDGFVGDAPRKDTLEYMRGYREAAHSARTRQAGHVDAASDAYKGQKVTVRT